MLNFEHRGEGPNVTLLLHGFLGSGRNLSSLARRWVERDPDRTIVLVDMTGHGRSPPLPANPHLKDIADDILALAEHTVGDEPLPIVGHSMGGRVALKARIQAPERVSSVTLLDISPGALEPQGGNLTPVLDALLQAPATAESREVMRASLDGAGLSRALADWLLMNLETADGSVRWSFDREALEKLYYNSRNESLWDSLELGATLSIRGGASSFVGDAEDARMASLGAITRTIPGAGHFLHVEAQDALLDLLVAESVQLQ